MARPNSTLMIGLGRWPGISFKASPLPEDAVSQIANLTDRSPTDSEWFAAMEQQRKALNSELGKFFAGEYDPDEFADALFVHILRGHAIATAAGRMRAGIHGSINMLDRQIAQFVGQEQSFFLSGFAQRLRDKEPRYWDAENEEWRMGMISGDLQMYASRYRGTANAAFEINSPDDAWFDWVNGIAEHCSDCLELAAESPHAKGELSVFPGDGGTKCIVKCKCHLRRRDGVTGFLPDPGVGAWVPDEDAA